MKILVLDGFALNPGDLSWKGIKELGTTVVYDRTEQARILNRIGDAEIVLVNKCPITRETIEACPNLKLICVTATGYNTVAGGQGKGNPGLQRADLCDRGGDPACLCDAVCHHQPRL